MPLIGEMAKYPVHLYPGLCFLTEITGISSNFHPFATLNVPILLGVHEISMCRIPLRSNICLQRQVCEDYLM